MPRVVRRGALRAVPRRRALAAPPARHPLIAVGGADTEPSNGHAFQGAFGANGVG